MSTSPRRLGKYELQEQLGSGGMAEVWKALDMQLQRYVAIKLLHANLQEDPHFIARFEREAQLIASLHHPNIVQIHDFQTASSQEEGTIAYMVMEYVEGQTLADYIRRTSAQRKFPSPAEMVQLFTPICLAVDYAHQHGVIHRDIKPANILLDKRNTTQNPMGEPVLTDFGLAKLLGTAAGTLTATQPGTPYYISPEQVRGYGGTERSDIYSLGIILFEMVTGTLPFQGNTPTAVMAQHLHATPLSPTLINPNVPPALTTVIMRCLAKDPAARFPSASALASAIAETLPAGEESTPTVATNLFPGVTPSSSSTPIVKTSTPPPASIPQQLSSSAPSTSGGQGTPMTPTGSSSGPTIPMYSASQSTLSPSSQPSPTPGESAWWASGAPPAPTPGGSVFTPAQSQPNTMPPPTPLPTPPPPRQRPRRALIFGSVVLLVVVLLSGLLGAYLLLRSPTIGTIVGHAFYVSSGQLVENAQGADGARGIADKLQVDMQNVQPPLPGKSYYLWLLADKDQTPKKDLLPPPVIHPPILLTNNLPVQPNGTVQYIYPGDAQRNNLLSATSRLLITLEDAGRMPASPSPDRSTWIYYAQLPQVYIPNDPTGLRGLDHIRHLYYNEDHLPVKARFGGLDIWVFRDTEKLLEWSTSARDDFDIANPTAKYGQMHDLFNKILDYLDGIPNVDRVDVPPGTPPTADTNIADISLLTVDPTRQGMPQYLATDPPGDLDHLLLHLSQLDRAPDATPEVQKLSPDIITAITNAKEWLTCARADAKQLFYMTLNQSAQNTAVCQVAQSAAACPNQSAQSTAVCLLAQSVPVCPNQPAQDMTCLLDDLVTQVTYAYIGQLDPNTNTITPGVLQAHYDVQQLATFDITRNVPRSL